MSKDVYFCSHFGNPRGAPIIEPTARFNVLRMSNIEHFSCWEELHYLEVKSKELTARQVLSVPCATCGASVGEACELHSGALRTEPHRERKLTAAEAAETRLVRRAAGGPLQRRSAGY